MLLIKFSFYFVLSFAILCIPIGDGRHLFDKLYGLSTPYANKAMVSTKQKLTATKRYSKKLYSNSEPLEKDEVKTRLSGTKKKMGLSPAKNDDAYTDEERERLKKVLNND